MHSIQRLRRVGRWLPRLGVLATLPHMKGVEVPSITPLGQGPMGMEGASCRDAAKGILPRNVTWKAPSLPSAALPESTEVG